jgi:SNF2 family DNA or RNA helicase
MEKRLKNDGYYLFDAKNHNSTSRKLFKSIRETELRVFERDEREGINACIADEDTRINKRLHPSLKAIQRVWIPRPKHQSLAGGDIDDDDDDERESGVSSLFFDAAYLEVDRVIAHRRVPGDDTRIEYLVKWCNLGYDDVKWEHEQLVGEGVIPQAAVDRFKASLALPTTAQLQHAQRLHGDRQRPKFTMWSDAHPCPPFAGGRTLRPYQLEGAGWLNLQFSLGRSAILADEMGSVCKTA